MSVFGNRVLVAVVRARGGLRESASLAGQTDAGGSRARPSGGFSGATAARPGTRPRIRSTPAMSATSCGLALVGAQLWSAAGDPMQVGPLIVDGVMYTTAGVNRDVVALDAATGQQLWHWRPPVS